MSESLQLRDPLFRLVLRFSNGETVQYVVGQPIDTRSIAPATQFAIVTSVSVDKPSELVDVSVFNLRDISYIKTKRVTLEQLGAERRMAGIRSTAGPNADDSIIKTLSTLSFIS
ncbi:MAG TPA: hypothetical protein VKM94_11915 [Blastocatellia bacterium]|nr:hypothetical protein [Blastocatellia bacterium]